MDPTADDARPHLVHTRKPRGVVAAGHVLTTEAAADVLHDGGTAIDSAIAALAMACACEPVLCSPGGGGFAMLRDGASGGVKLIDFFPHTPKLRQQISTGGVTEILANFGTSTQAFRIGPATAATPGFFQGLRALHARGTVLPMERLIAPAARAARDGVTITPFQHYLSTVMNPVLLTDAKVTELFAPGGKVLEVGAIFRNPGLANTLEMLADDKPGESEIDTAILAQQDGRGHLTASDLNSYRVIERTPKSVRVGGATVHLNPLPAAGGTLIAHSLAGLTSPAPVEIARAFHATDQARRSAEGDLSQLDAATLRQQGTTHVSVIDANGNACAVTTSNGVGNGELVDGFGFMLNNILGEEDVNPAGAHDWPLDARLSSGMCPTLIEMADGTLTALGSGGSNRIRSAICQVVVGLCLEGNDLETSVGAPRLHVERDHLDFENLFGRETGDQLSNLFSDHQAWPEPNMFFGGVHAVRMDSRGRFDGAGDVRRAGTSIVVD